MSTLDIEAWFESRQWRPFAFQTAVWTAMQQGQWGLLHASTGRGKTLAAWFGALKACQARGALKAGHLKVLWVTPMRALAQDTCQTLTSSAATLVPSWRVEMRTGDSSASIKARQQKHLPEVLITTPESLSLLLASAQAEQRLQSVQVVIVDEWHELLASKRGVQVQLALARLARWQPHLIGWAMSATLGNLQEACQTFAWAREQPARLITDEKSKSIEVQIVLPKKAERYSWAGQLGLSLLGEVVTRIEDARSTLVFVNTRAQAERWYQALLAQQASLAGQIALHHGSLDPAVRQWVERALKEGQLRAVVCTSSLDLGVDFSPVQQVIQIGSAKGVARLMQRAGRSGHAPGEVSRVVLVPTNQLEILEAIAARQALQTGKIESRHSPNQPIDVLVQHLVTVGLGGGFEPQSFYHEVRQAFAYRALDETTWQWALDFVSGGGNALSAYPDYRRVHPDEQGVWRVTDRTLARRHRMSIGTIVSDAMVQVRYWRKGSGGARLGQVQESFLARLNKGDCFYFAGRLLQLVRIHDMTAYVQRAKSQRAAIPRFGGGHMPLSTELADAMLAQLDHPWAQSEAPQLAIEPLLDAQRTQSALPSAHHLLIEQWQSRQGSHLFLYPFAGRSVHTGLAHLLAWRLARLSPRTFTMAVNDYGLELLCAQRLNAAELLAIDPFETERLEDDILASLNAGELAQRRFREIARISGLVFQGYPGAKKTARQVQASSGLFFEVFRQYDPDNALLAQARNEVLTLELDAPRLRDTLEHLNALPAVVKVIDRPTPFAFALVVQRWRERLSSEQLQERVQRLVQELEKAIES